MSHTHTLRTTEFKSNTKQSTGISQMPCCCGNISDTLVVHVIQSWFRRTVQTVLNVQTFQTVQRSGESKDNREMLMLAYFIYLIYLTTRSKLHIF